MNAEIVCSDQFRVKTVKSKKHCVMFTGSRPWRIQAWSLQEISKYEDWFDEGE
jgi:hypothetical protein